MPPKKQISTKEPKKKQTKQPKSQKTEPAPNQKDLANILDYTVEGDNGDDDEDDLDFLDYDKSTLPPELISENKVNTYEYIPEIHREIVYLTANNRITSEVLTKFEYAEIISIRAAQIEKGGVCYAENIDDISDPIELAKKELRDKRCPLNLDRRITDTIYEKWHVNEMALPA